MSRTQIELFIVGIVLGLVLFGIIVYAYVTGFQGCNDGVVCLRRLFFGAPYQYYFIPSAVVFLSLIPLFFTRKHVYRAWRKFALIGVPVVLLLVFLSPTHGGNDYVGMELTREVAAMLFSGLFLLTSWILIAYKSIKR